MQNTVKLGQRNLLFGVYAVRRFCILHNVVNDTVLILQAFGDENKADAVFHMVQAGLEASYASESKPFDLTEFQVSEFVDELNDSEDKAKKVVYAFMGAVLGKSTEDVPDYMKKLAEAYKEEMEKAEQSGNPNPQPKTENPSTGTN